MIEGVDLADSRKLDTMERAQVMRPGHARGATNACGRGETIRDIEAK